MTVRSISRNKLNIDSNLELNVNLTNFNLSFYSRITKKFVI